MSAKRAARRRAVKIRAKAAHRPPSSLSKDHESGNMATVNELGEVLARWQALGSEERAEVVALAAALPLSEEDSGSWDTVTVGVLAAAVREAQEQDVYDQRWQALTSEEKAELAALQAASDTDWDAYAQRMEDHGLAPPWRPEYDLSRAHWHVYEILRDRLTIPGAPAQVTVRRAWLAQKCRVSSSTVARAFADLRQRRLLDIEALGNGTVAVRLGETQSGQFGRSQT